MSKLKLKAKLAKKSLNGNKTDESPKEPDDNQENQTLNDTTSQMPKNTSVNTMKITASHFPPNVS